MIAAYDHENKNKAMQSPSQILLFEMRKDVLQRRHLTKDHLAKSKMSVKI